MGAAAIPLLDRRAEAPLFHRVQRQVDCATFLHEARTLADRMPQGTFIANLCRDRYAFALGFAAGLLRGCTSLLNVDPSTLAPGRYPRLVIVADTAMPDAGLPVVIVRPGTTEASPPTIFEVPEIPADHLAAIVFTSGSTGSPVPHAKSWGALVARSRAAARHFAFETGTIVGTVPPQHMYGFETTILLPLHAPVGSWCGPAFFPGDVGAALLACPEPRILVTTPLQLRMLVQADLHLPQIGACISATAPLDPELAATAEAAWAAPVLEIFGATECGSIAARRPTHNLDWKPYPGVEVRIEAAGAAIHADAADPVPLADVIEAAPGGFRLLGRRTDVVKLGGRRASLLGLNQVLTGLQGVDDGAFVMPDDNDQRSPARLVAIVVAPQRTAPAILADLRRVLDPIFLPRRVIRVDAMPRNALGKLPRQALLALVARAP